MKTMLDLDFKEMGQPQFKHICTEDILLSDKDFSDKENQIARTGDEIFIKHTRNFGMVTHPIFGIFRC